MAQVARALAVAVAVPVAVVLALAVAVVLSLAAVVMALAAAVLLSMAAVGLLVQVDMPDLPSSRHLVRCLIPAHHCTAAAVDMEQVA